MSFPERDEVERGLTVSFEDLYDAAEGIRTETRELEAFLNRLFRGENYGKTIE